MASLPATTLLTPMMLQNARIASIKLTDLDAYYEKLPVDASPAQREIGRQKELEILQLVDAILDEREDVAVLVIVEDMYRVVTSGVSNPKGYARLADAMRKRADGERIARYV